MSENHLPETPQGQPVPPGEPFVQPGQAGYQYAPQTPYTPQPNPQPNPQYAPQPDPQYVPQQNYQYAAAPVGRGPGIGSLQKDKWVAALLAFTLGWLGIHKFYLGYKNEGIVMLLVSLIGSLCLGLGMLVITVISVIEAVKYITLTQEDFERTYIYASKGWF